MIAVVREICIFMLIAQAVLLFVPGKTYVKYVRVLVGIMMIMGITGPLFGFFMDEGKKQEIQERAAELEQKLSMESSFIELPDNRLEIYSGIERELAEKLGECGGGYEVSRVELFEDKVIVTVREEEPKEEGRGEIRIEPITLMEAGAKEGEKSLNHKKGGKVFNEESLKELYGNQLGVNAENIEIALQ